MSKEEQKKFIDALCESLKEPSRIAISIMGKLNSEELNLILEIQNSKAENIKLKHEAFVKKLYLMMRKREYNSVEELLRKERGAD